MKKSADIQNKGFHTPENYFENFTIVLQSRMIEEQLKEQFGTKSPFTLPVNYFENFNVNIKVQQKSSGKIIQLFKPYLSVAAGIIIVFGVWQFILSKVENTENITNLIDTVKDKSNNPFAENTISFESIDLNEFSDEIDMYINETDAMTILEYTEEKTTEAETQLDSDEIYDYLMDYADDDELNEILASL